MLLDDIEHLPKVVTNVLGIKDVLLAIEPEIIQLRKDISDLIKELYVKTTKDFITRWEKDFSLKYDAGLTLEQRRQRILNKLARKRPLTWDNLRLLIKNNLAENVQFYLSNDAANYNFRIIINPEMEEVFDASKFTVVGSPTITADGIASGFSSSNYITATKNIDFTKPFVVEGEFATGSNITQQQFIFATTINYAFGLQVFDDRHLYAYYPTTTNSFKKTMLLSANTKYKYRYYYTGNELKLDINDETYTISTSDFNPTIASFINIGIGRTASQPFNGSIDLKQFSITVDGKEVFNGTKRVPKGISEMEKAVKQAKPAYLTFDILVTDIVRRCGTFNCGTNPL